MPNTPKPDTSPAKIATLLTAAANALHDQNKAESNKGRNTYSLRAQLHDMADALEGQGEVTWDDSEGFSNLAEVMRQKQELKAARERYAALQNHIATGAIMLPPSPIVIQNTNLNDVSIAERMNRAAKALGGKGVGDFERRAHIAAVVIRAAFPEYAPND